MTKPKKRCAKKTRNHSKKFLRNYKRNGRSVHSFSFDMGAIKEHFANIDFYLDGIKDEVSVIEKHGHETNSAVFARITDIEIDVTKAKEAIEQHINCKETEL